ncbi:Phospholipase C 4 precursor [Enhygromyxa salina]|uniref:Phospholipase C 4 n=1 Tax=Enhygromyxa salina TaxID=215803 RepID=A0A0C2D5Y1_9BACT|nr:alkaline phosphatase family protein [Enhygromyxa salina]KIG15452.1 Phospholipase C 4 precursor [Enhygromyxa salina]
MRFTTIAASDADIRGTDLAPGKSQVLSRADLDVLCTDHSWLTDALINYGVEECTASGPALTDLHHNVLWIRPALVKAGMEGGDDAFDAGLGAAIGWAGGDNPKPVLDTAPALTRGATVILFPVNTGDTHWSLLAFYKGADSAHCEFVHYDSLQPANTGAAAMMVTKLQARGFLSRGFVIANEAAVVRQDDGYNCGAFVIQFARLIMSLGAKPGADQLGGVTSHSSEEMRIAMLLALVPLVAPAPPVVGEWWEHPPAKLGKGESRPVEQDAQTRKEALAQIHKALEEDNAEPIQLSSIAQCKMAKPAKLTVVLASDNDEWHAAQGGSVTFSLGGEQFTRPVSYDGKRWMTSLTTKFAERIVVKLDAKVRPPEEFTEASASQSGVNMDPGVDQTVTLTFAPREPRRLHLALLVEADGATDGYEDLEAQSGPGKRRPFPAGTKIELLLDGGPEKVAATIQADGSVVDDGDGEAGVRIPFRCKGATPQFPDAKDKRYIAWDKDTAAGSPTVFLADPEQAKDTQRVGFCLPTGVWIPVRRPDNWTFPAAHYDSGKKLRNDLDLANAAVPPGSADAPIEYVLISEPPPFYMNGHLIEHVVCLMLENRGFDHFMGFLYEGATKPQHSYPPPSEAKGQHQSLRLFEGLEGMSPSCPYDYNYTTKETKKTKYGLTKLTKVDVPHNIKGVAKMRKGARASNIPTTNPHEDFIHIFQDMYGAAITNPHDMEDKAKREAAVKSGDAYKKPPMDGWAQNFCDGIRHHRGEADTILTNAMVDEIMEMYTPEQLPVMSGLARNYAVSDLWFCSVPSQTNTNRAFWACGHAAGICKNDWRPAIKYGYASDKMPDGDDANGIPFRRSLFDVLNDNGHDWKYYYSVPYPPALRYQETWKEWKNHYYFMNMFPQFKDDPKVTSLDEFYADAKGGTLPRVSYIEPTWGGGKKWDAVSPLDRAVGNEFHPVQDMFCGEFFVKEIYDAVINGPKADTTLLIITFDENGGTYDHFPPWAATPPDRAGNLPPGYKKPKEKKPPLSEEFGYGFDNFGVRVPTLLISKYIKPQTIFRSPTAVPLDHTSVISTVLKWLAIPEDTWKLGDRVANAPTFDGALMSEGEEETERRKVATGLAHFDENRKKLLETAKPLQYGQTFRLRYVGNKWADRPPTEVAYIADPVSSMKWWYPTISSNPDHAIKFKLTGGKGAVHAGSEVVFEATGNTLAGKSMAGYSLALPETAGAQKIYLYKGGKPSRWIPWIVNDRNVGTELVYGDELFLFSERYLPKNLAQPFSGVTLCDPYKRLTIDPFDFRARNAVRYASWRAGEWDIWVLEPVTVPEEV